MRTCFCVRMQHACADRQTDTFIYACMHTYIHRHKHTCMLICAQVKWGRGIPMDPHVVVLEAGLDSRAFDENLPVAPWL
jgi:hypothetical protein